MNNKKKGRVAVLLSGRGSNFEAIYRYSENENSNYEVNLVISNKKKARGLFLADQFGIPNFFISPGAFQSKTAYEEHLNRVLKEYNIQLVCLAGFMRILSNVFVRAFRNRIMNIHPSLLPAFPGLNAQRQAIEYGVGISGCTVHFVDTGVDSGPVILQKAVEVEDTDDEHSLSEKILKFEHELFPRAVDLYFQGRLKTTGRKVIIKK